MAEAIESPSKLDVIIIGAGISGIDAAYRVQTRLPDHAYCILEARDSIGGTWGLFRYPGIRSDTDLYCFGFPWRPWDEKRLIAEGPSILTYLKKSSAAENIDKKIRLHHRVHSVSWSSVDQIRNLTVQANGKSIQMHAKAIVVGCGYYDYNSPLAAKIAGLENFKGKVVHPQFWPEDLDYEGKKIIIVGSGATGITLLLNLADKASHVTMILPRSLVFKLVRLWLLILHILFYNYCRWFPQAARKMFRSEAVKRLGKDYPIDMHFKPTYNPWDQRVCFAPDGGFYQAIHAGEATVATGRIDKIGSDSIVLDTGEQIYGGIIVTATGLKLSVAGGMRFFVDGQQLNPTEKNLWRNSWLQDVPNCAFVLGCTNASWTLGAQTTALLFCRMLRALQSRGLTSAVPRVTRKGMATRPYLDLKSTYAQQGAKALPLTGNQGPWKGRTNYILDSWRMRYGSIEDGLDWYKGSVLVKKAV